MFDPVDLPEETDNHLQLRRLEHAVWLLGRLQVRVHAISVF